MGTGAPHTLLPRHANLLPGSYERLCGRSFGGVSELVATWAKTSPTRSRTLSAAMENRTWFLFLKLSSKSCTDVDRKPVGTSRHVDISRDVEQAVREALQTAPYFIDIDQAKPLRARPAKGESPTKHAGHSAVSPLASNTGTTSAAQSQTSSRYSQLPNMSLAVASSSSNVQSHPPRQPTIRQVYLYVGSASRHIIRLGCDGISTDVEFFAKMKTEYEKARGWPRLWFSMWRYEYCDFVEFCKYGMGIGAYVNIGFPDEHDILYDFEPRLPKLPPPDGPVYRDEFWAHYYHQGCPSLIDWRRYQNHR